MLQLDVADPEIFLESRGKTSRSCKQFISNIRDGIKHHTYTSQQNKQSLIIHNFYLRYPGKDNYLPVFYESSSLDGLLHKIFYCGIDKTNRALTVSFSTLDFLLCQRRDIYLSEQLFH